MKNHSMLRLWAERVAAIAQHEDYDHQKDLASLLEVEGRKLFGDVVSHPAAHSLCLDDEEDVDRFLAIPESEPMFHRRAG